MAIVIKSNQLGQYRLDGEQNLWTYCGLDNCLTKEVHEALTPLGEEHAPDTYRFARAMQAPALAMMLRGIRTDPETIFKVLHGDPDPVIPGYLAKDMSEERKKVELARMREGLKSIYHRLGGMAKNKKGKWEVVNPQAVIQRYAEAITGTTINYNSPIQLKKLVYERLHIEPVFTHKKGKTSISLDHETLEWLADTYPRAEPFCRALLRLRTVEGLIEVLEKGLDADGRMRCSYNVVGTDTGRWSSSKSVRGTGTNLQNITKGLRHIFVPDPGYTMFNVDLEQAESRAVAYLSGDEGYIHACESGDLHTTVASMVFGIPCERSSADRIYYRHFSYRDMAKRAGHGVNYGLTPHSLARHMHISVKEAYRFHIMYLGGELRLEQADRLDLLDQPHDREGDIVVFGGAFPGIRAWHEDTRVELELEGRLITPLRRRRVFWQRLNDSSTLRKAIAYRPQSLIGDLLNVALYRVWNELHDGRPGGELQLLGQVHDSIAGQIINSKVDEYVPRVLECMRNPVPINGRTMLVPAEAAVGPNWRDCKKWKPAHGS